MALTQLGFDDFLTNFLNALGSELGLPIDTTMGGAARALGEAATVNDMYLQTQAVQVQLDSRLDTATGTALDTWVDQFAPAFSGRVQAIQANQAPVDPTALLASAQAAYLYLASVLQLVPTQHLRLTQGPKGADADIVAVNPRTALTVAANPGDVALTVASTAGMFPGGTLALVDGIFTASATVTGVSSGTVVNITPLASVLSHAFATLTTVVTIQSVVQVTNVVFDGGTVLTDLIAGTRVTPTTALQGLQLFRNTPDVTTPNIPANNGLQSGYKVQTKINAVQYEVMADLANPFYDGVGAYVMPANAVYVYVPVRAVTAGAVGNVAAGTLTVLSTPLTGIDGSINLYPIANGSDAELDIPLRARFKAFISSQNSATKRAVLAAIAGVAPNLQYTIIENVASDGMTPQPGNFVVLLSDSTGQVTATLLAQVTAAVDLVRPLTSTFEILPPTVLSPTVVIVITVDLLNGFTLLDRIAAVQTAVYNYLYTLPAGTGWNFNKVTCAAQDVPGILDVPKVVIDGNGFDETTGSFVVVGTGPANGSVGPRQIVRPPLTFILVS